MADTNSWGVRGIGEWQTPTAVVWGVYANGRHQQLRGGGGGGGGEGGGYRRMADTNSDYFVSLRLYYRPCQSLLKSYFKTYCTFFVRRIGMQMSALQQTVRLFVVYFCIR